MDSKFKSKYSRYFKWGLGAFLLLFLFRISYGYLETDTNNSLNNSGSFFGQIENLRKNYASEKVKTLSEPSFQSQDSKTDFASNQKYEKTASLISKTSNFDEEITGLNRLTKDYKAVVQYEKNEGKKGSRELHLLIGVNPSLFDSFYLQIQKIGDLKTTEITKIDKTNEFRQLNAKKVSLEKTLTSLNDLKSRGGAIGDYVALHDKILEIEKQLQELGVELGNFDSENEFCSIRFSLYEGASERKISVLKRIKVALEWTIKYYLLGVSGVLCLSCFTFVLLIIIEKLNILKSIIDRTE
jgi:Domain of unknown function (DUF4349)